MVLKRAVGQEVCVCVCVFVHVKLWHKSPWHFLLALGTERKPDSVCLHPVSCVCVCPCVCVCVSVCVQGVGVYIGEHVFESGSAHTDEWEECFRWQRALLERLGLISGTFAQV